MRHREIRSDANRTGGDDPRTSRRRRDGRGWGPFTGAQLTVVIVTFAVLLLAPVGAWAVSGSPVFLTDPHNNHHAAIDAAGNVHTHPNGTQAITGTVSVT